MAWPQSDPSQQLDTWLVDDPDVPFYQELSAPLFPKNALYLSGTVPKHAQRFEINFIIDKGDSDPTIAFHYNPRFDDNDGDNYAAMNSRSDGEWEEELRTWECPKCHGDFENCEVEAFPFKLKKDFWMLIFFTSEEYLVSVNGHHVAAFKHRHPLNRVNAIEVSGDVDLTEVELKREDHYPPAALADKDYKLEVPYSRAFIDPVVPQTVIKVRGKIPKKADSFRVDLYAGWTDCSDIAFHVSPRFEEDSVYCNSFHYDEGWADEVVFDLTMFRQKDFYMEILVTNCEFIVSVAGASIGNFGHRMSLSDIKRIAISGDVKVKSVDIDVPQQYQPYSMQQAPGATMAPLGAVGMLPAPTQDLVAFGGWVGQRLQGMAPHVAADLRNQIQAIVEQRAVPAQYPPPGTAGYMPPGQPSAYPTLPPQYAPPGQYPQYQPPGPPGVQPSVPPAGPFCGWVPGAPPPI